MKQGEEADALSLLVFMNKFIILLKFTVINTADFDVK